MATIAEALSLGWKHYNAGNLSQAEQVVRQVLQADPANAHGLNMLGSVYQAQGKYPDAQSLFQQALCIKPDLAEAHNNLGVTLARQGKLVEAIVSFRRAVALRPAYPQAHCNLGNALRLDGQLEEAVASLREASRLQPNYADACNNLGLALVKLDRLDEAAASFRDAVRLNPQQADLHNNLGNVLLDQGKLAEAAESLGEAVRLQPDYADAHSNLGYALRNQGRYTKAMACFERALQLQPEHIGAHHNRSVLRILLGDYAQGWAEYEYRWRCPDFTPPPFRKPLWDGSPLAGRTILLHTEQGTGDTIQFLRYAPLVKERGGTVFLACPRTLVPLLSSCPGVARVIAKGDLLPNFEVHAPLMSLPHLFGTTPATIPAAIPYLTADPDLVERWRQELGSIREFKVGIAWQGSTKYREDRWRSIPLTQFAPLAAVQGIRLFSLQKGYGSEQLRDLAGRFPVTDLGSRLDETTGAFMETAAVLKNLDLLICCDTAVEHLAGALGVPVWIALPFVPDYRWLLDRADSPWYPTVRLFRQAELGKWEPVFERLAAALKDLVGRPKRSRSVTVEVPPGELIDKITILEIKSERLADAAKLENVHRELVLLSAARDRALEGSSGLDQLTAELRTVNTALWDVEDEIRRCEARQDFGPRFIELARSVYRLNDRRAALKRLISELLGSTLIEEKGYASYSK